MQIANIPQATAHAVPAHPAGSQSSPGTSASAALPPSILYAASAGGKTYTGDVSLAAGQYTAVVPQLPGISAIGPSMLQAESRLNQRISVLV
jgi:hypothetical protein